MRSKFTIRALFLFTTWFAAHLAVWTTIDHLFCWICAVTFPITAHALFSFPLRRQFVTIFFAGVAPAVLLGALEGGVRGVGAMSLPPTTPWSAASVIEELLLSGLTSAIGLLLVSTLTTLLLLSFVGVNSVRRNRWDLFRIEK